MASKERDIPEPVKPLPQPNKAEPRQNGQKPSKLAPLVTLEAAAYTQPVNRPPALPPASPLEANPNNLPLPLTVAIQPPVTAQDPKRRVLP